MLWTVPGYDRKHRAKTNEYKINVHYDLKVFPDGVEVLSVVVVVVGACVVVVVGA